MTEIAPCPIKLAAKKQRFEEYQDSIGQWAQRPVFDRLVLYFLKSRSYLTLDHAFDILDTALSAYQQRVNDGNWSKESALLDIQQTVRFWGHFSKEFAFKETELLVDEAGVARCELEELELRNAAILKKTSGFGRIGYPKYFADEAIESKPIPLSPCGDMEIVNY